jgi:hypothetical protein
MPHATWSPIDSAIDDTTWPSLDTLITLGTDIRISAGDYASLSNPPLLTEINAIVGLNQIIAEAIRRGADKGYTTGQPPYYLYYSVPDRNDRVTAASITTIRTFINNVRHLYGFASYVWTTATILASTTAIPTVISSSILTELRLALNDLQDQNEHNKWHFGYVTSPANLNWVAENDDPTIWNTTSANDASYQYEGLRFIGSRFFFTTGYTDDSFTAATVTPYNTTMTVYGVADSSYSITSAPRQVGSLLFAQAYHYPRHFLIVSSDGGENWSQVYLPPEQVYYDYPQVGTYGITILSSGRLLVGGSQHYTSGGQNYYYRGFWYSDDGGYNWTHGTFTNYYGSPPYLQVGTMNFGEGSVTSFWEFGGNIWWSDSNGVGYSKRPSCVPGSPTTPGDGSNWPMGNYISIPGAGAAGVISTVQSGIYAGYQFWTRGTGNGAGWSGTDAVTGSTDGFELAGNKQTTPTSGTYAPRCSNACITSDGVVYGIGYTSTESVPNSKYYLKRCSNFFDGAGRTWDTLFYFTSNPNYVHACYKSQLLQ